MTEEARLHEMIAAACLRAGSEAAFTADLRGFLEAHAVDEDDILAILAAPPRLSLYRRLVRNNLTGVTEKMLARTRARVNAIADGAFDASFAAFLDEVGPRTHYLRDVPGEFLDWVEPRWRASARAGANPELPPWVVDLARHELVEFQLGAAMGRTLDPPVTEIAPDRAIVFAEPIRLMRYAFAVHELPPGRDDRSEPALRATALLVCRDGENVVQFLELTPFAAAITERLLGGAPLLDAVRDAATDVNATSTPDGESARSADRSTPVNVATFLADLGARGILLGGRG